MYAIVLRESRLKPAVHRTRSAHHCPPVPKCAAVFHCDRALDLGYFIQMAVAPGSQAETRRSDDQEAGGGRCILEALDETAETIAIRIGIPVALECFVGAVGEHDKRGVTLVKIPRQDALIPVEQLGGLRTVDPERLPGHAAAILRHPPVQ